VGIFFYLSKAYDIINYNRLLDKLDSYGVRSPANRWFKSYLTNRTQFVEIYRTDRSNHAQRRLQSLPKAITHAIAHGSILASLCF
jgi:hypothetical protein